MELRQQSLTVTSLLFARAALFPPSQRLMMVLVRSEIPRGRPWQEGSDIRAYRRRIARALGFRVPELVFLDLDENFGRTEGDEEVQDLLKASTGLNLGLHYLSGAFTVDPYVNEIDDDTASRIVWLCILLPMSIVRCVIPICSDGIASYGLLTMERHCIFIMHGEMSLKLH